MSNEFDQAWLSIYCAAIGGIMARQGRRLTIAKACELAHDIAWEGVSDYANRVDLRNKAEHDREVRQIPNYGDDD